MPLLTKKLFIIRKNLIVLLFATLLFASCSNVGFTNPQPEFLEPLTKIPEKFQGVYVVPELDSAKYIVSNLTIADDSINNGKLVVKSWGNYLFINELTDDFYSLTVGKAVKFLNHETLSVHFINLDSNQTHLFNIVGTEKGGEYSPDVTYFLDDVNRNQFQTLLNNSKKLDVIRIE